MKTPPKIVSLLVAGVIGLAGISLLTPVWSKPQDERYPQATRSKSDREKGSARHHGRKSDCRARSAARAGMHRKGRRHRRGSHSANELAKRLNVMETEIGIRANQLDAWRDFTDAMLAMTMPAPPTQPGADMAMPAPERMQPFGLAESFAKHAVAQGQSAEALLNAIDTLRNTLTSEQLARVEAMGRFAARPHHRRKSPFHKRRGAGPRPDRGDRSAPSDDTAPSEDSPTAESPTSSDN